ncbi:amidohydrolase family protein [Nocardia sp. ET3-3]|uniref:Amidohydrolase family protein n=1 Tax=Nocardia terrae TaxID=2675851 RepID=A0A7K1UQN0_9NOCA|nr:amidohydrolase [Nocardia terrae]MVU76634.1 amidohydrolase family protein [Nocardia terrae]
MSNERADLLIRAEAIHTLVPGQPPQRALAVRGDRIVAVSPDRNGLDAWATGDTVVIDRPDAVVLPSFDDTHTHLMIAANSAHDVPVHTARDIPELLELIRERAQQTPPGQWIRTTANWQEINLPERRFPTARELDSATDKHPVLLMRGGHNIVVNSAALELAGITAETPVPAGGHIGRDADGALNGWLQDNAIPLIARLLPQATLEQRIDGFRAATQDYAAKGIGAVRDAMVPVADLPVLRAALEADALRVRVRVMVSALGFGTVEAVDDMLDRMEEWRYLPGPRLGVWGVKFGLDGGIEAGATREPYACDHAFHGYLTWEPEVLVEAMDRVIRRGWRIGTHAYGDRAIEKLLDVYAELQARHPALPAGWLVMEHGGLADAGLRARAVAMGIPVTIQQPLQHDVARIQDTYWGPERVDRLFPARGWIDAGALVTGGSDYPVGAYGAMRSVWGMVTRETVTGVRGPEHAITAAEAIALHTTNAVALLGESDSRGLLAPGRLADLTLWELDPATAPADRLRDLEPTHTVIGGRLVHGEP